MIARAANQRVIVGLGNPGKKYELTRHNMGYLVVQGLAELKGWAFKEYKALHALAVKGQMGEVVLHLLLPTTYMNENGQAVRRYLDYYKLTSESLIAVVDDIALPYGEMRVKEGGSAGGHNGLKSLNLHLGTEEYIRLRMGIGQELRNGTLAEYVLDTFSKEELEALPKIIQQGASIAMRLTQESVLKVMNEVNKKTKKKQPGEG